MTPSGKRNEPAGERLARIEVQLEHLSNTVNAGGWLKRSGYWFWPLLTILISCPILWFGLSSAIDKHIDGKLAEPLRQMAQIRLDDADLKGQLKNLMDLYKEKIKHDASLTVDELRRQLPATTLALKSATVLRVPPPSNFGQLETVLRSTNRSNPGFWPAAAALISYESSLQSITQPQAQGNCFTVEKVRHSFKGNLVGPSPITNFPRYYEFGDCRLDLGDLDALNRANLPFLNDPSRAHQPVIFRLVHVELIYGGGAVLPFQEVDCTECTFDITSPVTPSEPSKRLIEKLLYADLNAVKLERPA
jgi:hypothetical protein